MRIITQKRGHIGQDKNWREQVL